MHSMIQLSGKFLGALLLKVFGETTIGIKTRDYLNVKQWYAITHPCHNFNIAIYFIHR